MRRVSAACNLLGVKLASPVTTPESCKANFTNEGSVGYIRYLKNIMGLWIIQCVQKQLGISFAEMVELAKNSTYTRIFDGNEACFSAPQDMSAEIRSALAETGDAPAADADLRSRGAKICVIGQKVVSFIIIQRIYLASRLFIRTVSGFPVILWVRKSVGCGLPSSERKVLQDGH